MSHRNQPVFGAQGSTRKLAGSATMTKSAPPSISAMLRPPPGVNTGNAVLCAVSLASSVVVMLTPLLSAAAASPATSVLPRSTPCWSAKENRTNSNLCFLIAKAAAAPALACSSVHNWWRSTKLNAAGRRGISSLPPPARGGGGGPTGPREARPDDKLRSPGGAQPLHGQMTPPRHVARG